jgi:hypothetical protein
MTTTFSPLKARVTMAAVAVLVLCSLSQGAVAADTQLVIRRSVGYDVSYLLSDVVSLTYGTSDLNVTTSGGTDSYLLSSIDRVEFAIDGTVTSIGNPGVRPISPTHLFQNFPNPFNPQTQIAFDLPSTGRAEIRIYDVRGRLVRTLVDEQRPAGHQILRWDGRDDDGREVASGTYFYRLSAPGVNESRKMVVVR